MLGFFLSQSLDLVYNISFLGYKAVAGLYNWYYSSKEIRDLRVLEDRVHFLEHKLKITKEKKKKRFIFSTIHEEEEEEGEEKKKERETVKKSN